MEYPTANAAQREQGPITMRMTERMKLQSELHSAINRLESRLQPLLGPRSEPPSPGNGALTKPVERNHAQEIASANCDIEHMISWVNSITNRIEL